MKQIYEVVDYQGIEGTRGEIYSFTSRTKAIKLAQKIANSTGEPEYVEICDMGETQSDYCWGANDIRLVPQS